MAADANSLADCMTSPGVLKENRVSNLSAEERAFLGLDLLMEEGNEAQRLQMLQRLVVRMTSAEMTPFDIQHELGCCGFEINLLRIKAILENPLARAAIIAQRRATGVLESEEDALAAAAPDCIHLLHEVVRNPFSVVEDPSGGQPRVTPILMSDRLFAAKQLLDRYTKTAPMSHRKTTHQNKGLVGQDDLAEMKALHSKALLNESTGVEGD